MYQFELLDSRRFACSHLGPLRPPKILGLSESPALGATLSLTAMKVEAHYQNRAAGGYG